MRMIRARLWLAVVRVIAIAIIYELWLRVCCAWRLIRGPRKRRYFKKAALTGIERSAFRKLLQQGDDNAYIICFTVDRATFNYLLIPFESLASRVLPHNPPVPRQLTAMDLLGLALMFVASSGQLWMLCLITGCTAHIVSEGITLSRRLLHTVLSALPEAQPSFPSPREIRELGQIAFLKYPTALLQHRIWAVMDGTVVEIPRPSDTAEQNAYYSGRYTMHCINNVFVFAFNGKIVYCAVNCPGSWHDSHCIEDLLQELLDHPDRVPPGFLICADSAFPRTDSLAAKIIKPLSDTQREKLEGLPEEERQQALHLSAYLCKLRVASEWGNSAVKANGRLRVPLKGSPAARNQLMSIVVLLHNLRVHRVGVSQIANVYNVLWHVDDQSSHDRVAEYFALHHGLETDRSSQPPRVRQRVA